MSRMTRDTPSASVVITTRDREASLMRALSSLQEQTLSALDLLVVDNARTEELAPQIEVFNRHARIPVRYVSHPWGGNAEARNRGALEALADLIVFTDDDLTMAPRWAEAYVERFATSPMIVAAGGPVRPKWESPPPKWLREYSDSRPFLGLLALVDVSPTFIADADALFVGCNMAFRRSVFERFGFHPELYGRRTIGDGETGLLTDLRADGSVIGYVPDALVFHHVSADRMGLAYIRRWSQHLGAAEMYARWHGRRRSIAALGREAAYQAARWVALWLKDLSVRRRTDPAALDLHLRASTAWWKLRYVSWMVGDPEVQHALDIKDFSPVRNPGSLRAGDQPALE